MSDLIAAAARAVAAAPGFVVAAVAFDAVVGLGVDEVFGAVVFDAVALGEVVFGAVVAVVDGVDAVVDVAGVDPLSRALGWLPHAVRPSAQSTPSDSRARVRRARIPDTHRE